MTSEHDARFDIAMRARHHDALQALSPRVRAQLAQRRHAALRGDAAPARHRFAYAAAALAAVCALALGLQFRALPVPGGTVVPVIAAAGNGPTMLDEDPEFYAWLASSDAQLVAKE